MSTQRKKSVSWSPRYESILFELWEVYLGAMRSAQKNTHIYQSMCEKLLAAGFIVTWKDVRTKLDNLTKKYKDELKKMEVPGAGPSKWHHFHNVHKILGIKSEHFSSIFVDSPDIDNFMPSISGDSDNVPSSSRYEEASDPPSKKWKNETNLSDEMTPFESAMLAATRERTEEFRRFGTALMDFIGRFEKSCSEFQTKLLDKL